VKYTKPVLNEGALRRGGGYVFDKSSRVQAIMMGVLTLLATLGAGAVQAKPDVTFIDQSNAASTNIPVTFGQVFTPGDVPAGLSVKVNVGGNPLLTRCVMR